MKTGKLHLLRFIGFWPINYIDSFSFKMSYLKLAGKGRQKNDRFLFTGKENTTVSQIMKLLFGRGSQHLLFPNEWKHMKLLRFCRTIMEDSLRPLAEKDLMKVMRF